MTDHVVFKRYPNRRLYNTEKSAYVTLSQISDIIKEGRRVRVLDAKTGEDVTAFILTQIIVEEAKNKNALLPAPLLHLVIRYGGNVLSEFFEKYLELSIKNYLTYKSALDEQFKAWLGKSMDISSLTPGGFPPFMSMESILESFSDWAKKLKSKRNGKSKE
ncbi:polyhydroxyalkanoate synthesis regulator DNA-binding domain-containing protein [Desulforhabdus amnigena]|nr:polyhydroxyalkanoate synthesis regulator DNA-binding domain-containing protein [Desulforhabdus amnigena]